MSAIIRLIIIATVIVIVALFVYYLIYQSRINKRILRGELSGRKMIDIPKVVLISVIVLLMLYSGIMFNAYQSVINEPQVVSRDNYAVIDASTAGKYEYMEYCGNVELEDASFAEVYSKDAIPGYDREVTEDGDFTFITFTRNSPADSFHPDFLCFVEYKGTDGTGYTFYQKGEFLNNENGEERQFGTGSGGDIPKCMLYIGNLNQDELFKITISVLDEDAETKLSDDMEAAMQQAMDSMDEFPKEEDYAIDTACVQIQMRE